MRNLNVAEIELVSGGFFENGDDELTLPPVQAQQPDVQPNRPWDDMGLSVGEYLFGSNYGLLIGLDVLAANDALDDRLSGETVRAMREEAQETQEQREAEMTEEQEQLAREEYQQFLDDAMAYCAGVDAARDIIDNMQIPADELADMIGNIFADGMNAAGDGFCENL